MDVATGWAAHIKLLWHVHGVTSQYFQLDLLAFCICQRLGPGIID